MIDREHELPVKRQAELLQLSRSGLYYRPRPVPAADLAVMRRLDELHLEAPFAGSRMLRDMLRADGVEIGRGRVATLMRRMGISALYRRPNTSKPAPGHRIYPYLLRGVTVERPNQVWAMDITYIPMARGGDRLVQPAGAVVAAVDHPGHGLLPGGGRGGAGAPWAAGDLQHRPGQPVHQRCVHRHAAGERHRDQHGRPGRLARQRVRGEAMALGQVRGGVSAGLRRRRRGARLDRPVPELLQRPTAALELGRADPGSGLLRRPTAAGGGMKTTAVCGPRSGRATPSLHEARKRQRTTEPAGDPLIRRRILSERSRPPQYSVSRHLSFVACPKRFFAENLSDDPEHVRLGNINKNSPALLKHETLRRDLTYIIKERLDPEPGSISTEAWHFVDKFWPEIRNCNVIYFDDIGTYTTFWYQGLDIAGQVFICIETDEQVIEYRIKSGRWVDQDKDKMHAAVSACWYRSYHDNPTKPFISRFMYLNDRFVDQGFLVDYSVDDEFISDFIGEAKRIERSIKDIPEFFATPGNDSCRFCSIVSVCDENENFRMGESGFRQVQLAEHDVAVDEYMFFLSHQSGIKDSIVRPLCRKLDAENLSYWIDREHLLWGRGGVEEMNAALRMSRYVVYFLNREFFTSNWARTEFFNRVNRDIGDGRRTFLPLIVSDKEFVRAQAPIISDTLYEDWDRNTLGELARKLRRIADRGI